MKLTDCDFYVVFWLEHVNTRGPVMSGKMNKHQHAAIGCQFEVKVKEFMHSLLPATTRKEDFCWFYTCICPLVSPESDF